MSKFSKLALTASVMTVIQIALGALVRATKSGLGCGNDWPHCHGRLVPALADRAVIIEYSHRLAASIVMGLALALAVMAWLKYRHVKTIFWPSFIAFILVLAQSAIGGLVVVADLDSLSVVLHFLVATCFLAVLVFTTISSMDPRRGAWDRFAKHCLYVASGIYAVLLIGAFVSQFRAALAFPDWPLMGGRFVPSGGGLGWLHYFHRVAALAIGVAIADLAFRGTRSIRDTDRLLGVLPHAMFGLWLVQAGVGAINVFTRSAAWAIVAHVATGALLWATAVALVTLAYRGSAQPLLEVPDVGLNKGGETAGRPGLVDSVKAYFFLTKPRIIELLLITTVPSMIVAARGWPPAWLIIATLVGGSLAAGSANAINCYVDRDIDEKMPRTSSRPLPAHAVQPRNALTFGVVLGVISFVFLWLAVNPISALLATSAILFYVFIYTLWMKRSTPSNIVIGGAAGAVPALVGWSAVTGHVGPAAWVLFAIIFYWTPPHFWALAIRYRDEYESAGVPMLPVVRGEAETTRQMLLYSFVLFATSMLLYPVAKLGVVYLVAAVVLGTGFIWAGVRLNRAPDARRAMSVFHMSITYLVLLFVAMAVDRVVDAPAIQGLYVPVVAISAAIFLIFETAILLTVVGIPKRLLSDARPLIGAALLAEVVWTILPIVIASVVFLLSWQTGSLASP